MGTQGSISAEQASPCCTNQVVASHNILRVFFFFLYKVPGKAFQGVFLPSRSCEIMVTNRKEARLIKHRAEYGT